MASGTRIYQYFNTGKEATHGTSVAATRRWYPDTVDWNLDTHPRYLGASGQGRGTATGRYAGVSQGISLDIPYSSLDGCSFNELVFPLSQLDAAQTGTGASADKTWTFAINQTAQEDYESYTIEFGDETQEYEAAYCQAEGFTLNWDASTRDNMTDLSVNWFGRQSTKSTVTAALGNVDVRIPAYLWKTRFAATQAGLAGASDSLLFMRGVSIEVDTGIRRNFYSDGRQDYGNTARAMPVEATITLTVDSLAQAVTQFYDKAATDPKTVDFIQCKATGPTLGGSTYVAQFQVAVVYDEPTIISGDVNGLNQYQVVGHLVYDPTWATSMAWTVTNAIAALTA